MEHYEAESGQSVENNQNVLTQSVTQYMIAMGTRPLIDTVNLIVEIILEQIEIIMDSVNEIAGIRNEARIDLEDFLFLMRKDEIRLKRLFNFLTLTKSFNEIDKQPDDVADLAADSKESSREDQHIKKFKKFLNKIDTKCGAEYDKVLSNDSELVDYEKLQQLYRLDKQFEHVTSENYIELVNLRRKAYKNISQSKFKCLNSLVWNKKTLSQLIETTLLLKKEQRQRNHYLKLTLQPHQAANEPHGEYFFQSITPNEIMETCRRCLLKKNSALMNIFSRNTSVKQEKNRLLFF